MLTQTERINRYVQIGVIAFALIIFSSDVQAQTAITGSLKKFATLITAGANILFVILMIFGLIKTIGAFISQSPNAPRYLLYLLFGAMLWYGFDAMIADIAEGVGSSSSGGGFDSK